MEQQEFQGLCPLCYKPVKAEEEFRTLQGEGRNETYHAGCLHQFIQYNSSEGKRDASLGISLLEQYKGLILPSLEKREDWITENKFNWLATGQILRERREENDIPLKKVANAVGVSIARLKRFEAGEPVRDAKLLYNGYFNFLYICHLQHRLCLTTIQLERSQDELLGAITLYEKLSHDFKAFEQRWSS